MEEAVNFAWPVTVLGQYDYNALSDCLEQYRNIVEQKEIVIFGAGIRGTIFSILLQQKGYTNLVFTDNNENKVGNFINEFPIISFSDVCEKRKEVFIIVSAENGEGIKRQLENNGFQEGIGFALVENHVYEEFIEEFFSKRNTETLVLGDCGLTDVGLKDNSYTTLGDLLKGGREQTKVLAMHGMGMRAYYQLVKLQSRAVEKPKKLMVMANFETFTGKQHLLPRSQHVQLFELLYEKSEDTELEEYLKLIRDRFANLKMDYFTFSHETMKRDQRNDKIVFKMNYMYNLSLENECIQYMFYLSELCKEQDIPLAFFIPPVNYQYAEKLWGEEFKIRYEKNCKRLKEELSGKSIPVLDLSYMFPSDKFGDCCTVDECLNFEGRKLAAEAMLQFLDSI